MTLSRSSSASSTSSPKPNRPLAESAQRDDVEPVKGKPPIWYAGTFFFVTGSLLNFVSFGFAAQSLLAALGSAQFISNVVFGYFILGETVTAMTVAATFVIIAGNAIVVYFSSHSATVYTADDLLSFYDTDFNIYAFVMIGCFVSFRLLYHHLDKRVNVGEQIAHSNLFLPLLYTSSSAILGTQSVVQAKCLSILLRSTADGSNQLGNPFTYGVLVAWLASTSFWLTRMNRALSMFDGLFVIPVLQVFWTFFSIVSGGIYFEEFDEFSPGQMVGFSFGVLVVFIGVYMLAPGAKEEEKVGDDAEDTQAMNVSSVRARGFSWDRDDADNTRMVNVWTATNDDKITGLVDNEPLAKFEIGVGDKLKQGAKRVSQAIGKGGAGGKFGDNQDMKGAEQV